MVSAGGDGGKSVKKENTLASLEAVVLSMDWEITDEIMDGFIDELEKLKNLYQKDKNLLLFLQIHDSLARYIKTKKAASHPDAIKLVQSVFAGLKKVVTDSRLDENQKRQIFLEEVEKLKELKKKILVKSGRDETRADAPGKKKALSPAAGDLAEIKQAIDGLRKYMEQEFAALKKTIAAINKTH